VSHTSKRPQPWAARRSGAHAASGRAAPAWERAWCCARRSPTPLLRSQGSGGQQVSGGGRAAAAVALRAPARFWSLASGSDLHEVGLGVRGRGEG